jgi:predicted dinucleotide-binding enzyme
VSTQTDRHATAHQPASDPCPAAVTILLAVLFPERGALANATEWRWKRVIGVLAGAWVVKASNHVPAASLAADPDVNGGRRVVFVSSDGEAAAASVAALAEQLGFAPVNLVRFAGE